MSVVIPRRSLCARNRRLGTEIDTLCSLAISVREKPTPKCESDQKPMKRMRGRPQKGEVRSPQAKTVNWHTRESHIQRSFRTHCGTERQLGGGAAGPARSSRRKSTLLAVPSLLDEKELHDEKEFLQQMRAGPVDRRFPFFVGLRCMLFHTDSSEKMARCIRDHWQVENCLHWVLDITFRQDDCRIRKANAAASFATVNHVAINLLKRVPGKKMSVPQKRRSAAWDDDYMETIIRQ